GTTEAAASLAVDAVSVAVAEIGAPAFGAWAAGLVPFLAPYHAILLPASADGRDLAPRLAAAMGRPLLAGATEYRDDEVRLTRCGGLLSEHVTADGPVVVTLQPGVRGTEPRRRSRPVPEPIAVRLDGRHDAVVLDVSPPDPGTMDLAESSGSWPAAPACAGRRISACWPGRPPPSAHPWARPASWRTWAGWPT